MAAGDTGKVSPGGRMDFPEEGLIPCRFRSGYSFLQRATVPQKKPAPAVKMKFSCRCFLFLFFLFLRCKNGTVHKWRVACASLRLFVALLLSQVPFRVLFLQRATVPQKKPAPPSENRIFLCVAVFFCFVIFALQKRHCSQMGVAFASLRLFVAFAPQSSPVPGTIFTLEKAF